jgi:hypothetical protein
MGDDRTDAAPDRDTATERPARGAGRPRDPDEEALWAIVRALAEPAHHERL